MKEIHLNIALLSDIHGNRIALDAVLSDVAQQGGVDRYWVLGDLVALGPDPAGVLERLTALPNIAYVRGNTDRYVFAGDRPPPTPADAARDVSLLPRLVEIAGSFAWTQGAVTAAGWFEWLQQLPLEVRCVLPDGTRMLGVHAAPGSDDGTGLRPEQGDAELASLLQHCDADLVCVGHTHRYMDRRIGSWHVINLGSVSNPPPGEWRASYVIVRATTTGYQMERRLVDYDRGAVIEALERLEHPGAGWISRQFRGKT